MHKTISYVIYTSLTGYSDRFQYRRPVKLISFCVKTNTFYKLTVSITYILSILQICDRNHKHYGGSPCLQIQLAYTMHLSEIVVVSFTHLKRYD